MKRIFCLAFLLSTLTGCTSTDKYSGEYLSDETTLLVEKNKNNKNEYHFKFSNMRIEYDFFTEIKQDGTVSYVMKDQQKINDKDNCKLDIKFFNDSVSIKQDPCGVYTFEGTFSKEKAGSKVADKQTPAQPVTTSAPAPAPAKPNTPTEQKIIFKVNSMQYNAQVMYAKDCDKLCSAISEDVNSYMSQGWKVVSSTPRTQPIRPTCSCEGVEYVLSK